MTPNEQSVAVRGKVGAGIRISSADSGACVMRSLDYQGAMVISSCRFLNKNCRWSHKTAVIGIHYILVISRK